jgi:hypothetical protein
MPKDEEKEGASKAILRSISEGTVMMFYGWTFVISYLSAMEELDDNSWNPMYVWLSPLCVI